MKIGTLEAPDVFAEALCAYRIFAAAGVPLSSVYVIPNGCIDPNTGEEHLGVQARDGERTFTLTVGKLNMTVKEFKQRWPEVVWVYRKLPAEEAIAVTDRTAIRSQAVEIFFAMAAKGFRIAPEVLDGRFS